MYLFQSGSLRVRPLAEEDAVHLVKWLSDPTILQYYAGRDHPHDMKMVRDIFYQDGDSDSEFRCLIEYDSVPIGYVQFYELDHEYKQKLGYAMPELNETIYGADQFIGEPDYWNKGIGKSLVGAMVEYIVQGLRASRVVMDPQTWNTRSIACYEKCGFRKIKLLEGHEWHEGERRDSWLMEYAAR